MYYALGDAIEAIEASDHNCNTNDPETHCCTICLTMMYLDAARTRYKPLFGSQT